MSYCACGGKDFGMEGYCLTMDRVRGYVEWLRGREYGAATVQKYRCDVFKFWMFLGEEKEFGRETVMRFKASLLEKGYEAASVNGILTAVNGLLRFMGCSGAAVRLLKIQRQAFRDRGKQMGMEEFKRMAGGLDGAGRNEEMKSDGEKSGGFCDSRVLGNRTRRRAEMIAQTISSLGLRVSELPAVTVEAVNSRRVSIYCKGKSRQVPVPGGLKRALTRYCEEMDIASGAIFVTRTGRAVHRTNVWRELKCLAAMTGVSGAKAYPHNFRHFFACMYYRKYHDLVGLSAILGHSNINTTRIYAALSAEECEKRMDELGFFENATEGTLCCNL